MLRDTVSYLQRNFQQNFLPFVEEQLDSPLLTQHRKVAWTLETVQIERLMPSWIAGCRGRPTKAHRCIARALVAKHVLNLATTDMLIYMLRIDKHLRYLCGWEPYQTIPSKSTFSRVFAIMADLNIAERIHEALIKETLQDEIVPHAAMDSMPIPVRERPEKKKTNQKRKREKEKDRVCFQQANNGLSLEEKLNLIPTQCATARKVKPSGNTFCWNGYKLHTSVAEGKFILGMVMSSASTNDCQVAIPLSQMASSRATILYELMDTAYDVDAIKQYIARQGRIPIVKEHKRSGKRNERVTQERRARKNLKWLPAEAQRLKCRASAERVFARLADGFSTLRIFVRGFKKVKAHVALSVLAHTADELRLCPT